MDKKASSNLNIKGWKEVRLFISSTFRDMHAERDYLVRYVFPKVREELLNRHIYFIDVDLRWGLTSDDDIVGACRSIIDECRPLFLGILGGRYGWVPGNGSNAISVTEDEIEHAIVNLKNGNYQELYFLFRDDNTKLSIPEPYAAEYYEKEGSENALKLHQLKERLKTSGYEINYYSADWNNSTCRFTNLEDFGNIVYGCIMTFAEKTFGAIPLLAEIENEDNSMEELFISQHNHFFISEGLENTFDAIESAAGIKKENNIVLLSGQNGSGKSAFLCKLIERMESRCDLEILHHFIGVSPHSSELFGCLKRFCTLLAAESNCREPIPYEIDKLIIYFQLLLTKMDQSKHYVLLLDAINQFKEDNNAYELLWLPQILPPNVTLILSSTPGPLVEVILKRWPMTLKIELKGLSPSASHNMIKYYLSRYQKRLTPYQIELLLKKKQSNMPLYLSTIIDELRIFGDYDGLDAFIQSLPGETIKLLDWILDTRLVKSTEFTDDSGQCISKSFVPRYLSLMYISDGGLSEKELEELLEAHKKCGNTAALTRQLRPFLTLHGQLLTFYHEDIKAAVLNTFIKDITISKLHEELASYFKSKADTSNNSTWLCCELRPFSQLLYHVMKAGNFQLLDSIVQSGFLEKYAKLETPEVFLRQTRKVAGALCTDAGNKHWEAICRCTKEYSDINKISMNATHDKPHPLERAIAEGRDEDALTLMASSSHGLQAAALEYAAKALYTSVGRTDRAQAIDLNISFDYGASLKNSQELYMLFSAISHGAKEINSESSCNEAVKEDDIEESNTNIKKKKNIPLCHIMALSFTGRFRYLYITLLGIAFFALLITIGSPIFLLMLGLPYWILNKLYKKSNDWVMYRSEEQLLSMAASLQSVKSKKQIVIFLRISKYIHLLKLAKISDVLWRNTRTSKILSNTINNMNRSREFKAAGLALACTVNLDRFTRDSIARTLRELPDNELYQVMENMLKNKRIIFEPLNALDFVIMVYNYSPPVSILMNVITLQSKKEQSEAIKLLYTLNKPVLASCLLRFLPTLKFTKAEIMAKRVKTFMSREFYFNPKTLSLQDIILIAFYIAIFIPIFLIALIVVYTVFGFSAYYSFILLPYPLYRLCKSLNQHEDISKDIESTSPLYFQDEVAKAASLMPFTNRGGVSAVETAIADSLIKEENHPEDILGKFPEKTILRVWKSLLYPGRLANREKLLLSVMDASDLLPKVLKKNHSGKTRNASPIDSSTRKKQWRRVSPLSPRWISVVAFIFISALVSLTSMGMMFILSDKWLKLVLLQHGWLVLAVTVFAGLLPIPKLRYITIYILPFSLFALLDRSKPFPFETLIEGESVIYSLMPTLSILLAYKVINKWRCTDLIYPVKKELVLNKLKCSAIFLIGSLLIGLTIPLAFNSADFVGDVDDNPPAMNEISVLKDYSSTTKWMSHSSSLYKKTLDNLMDDPFDWNPYSIYLDNLRKQVNKFDKLLKLQSALVKYGDSEEAENCNRVIFQNLGWSSRKIVNIDGVYKTIFLDNKGTASPMALVVTAVYLNTPADKLGIQFGDIIETINGSSITYSEDFPYEFALPENVSDGDMKKIALTVRRKDRAYNYTTSPGDFGIRYELINSRLLKK